MNFEHILEHHLMDHRFGHFLLGGIDFGLSNHLVMLWVVSALVTAVLSFAARSGSGLGRMLRGAVESIVLYLRDGVLEPIFGHHTGAYLPYFLTLFFFILTCNVVGLIPGAHAITANITITAALACCTFVMIQLAGVLEQGPVSYVVHIVPGGVPAALWPVLFAIEVFGMFAKCISLAIRLFANIIAGHIVSLASSTRWTSWSRFCRRTSSRCSPPCSWAAPFTRTKNAEVAPRWSLDDREHEARSHDMNIGIAYTGVFVGAGLCLIGGAYGISKLASSALDGAARQPEASGSLQTMMIIPAAMIEGLGLLALVIAFLAVGALNKSVASAGSSAEHAAAATH
ncbi:MAG: F0F1 ATP synthase subunit A [Elusimicrobia bacterium]|nr:F0F1 ATP synthase subunit A [Elusimicrobiota bacterium]